VLQPEHVGKAGAHGVLPKSRPGTRSEGGSWGASGLRV
jgi:hypothetical protein